ncbi:UNVERIFIED_CONTAM: hypothetical protein PYX00_000697 [Menopon gallinae]|uniref:Uncharacterized protein n=1 Tax=Menopon gallinae TaxID=328185 RepID=A0AAW2IA83_9NEOP
MNCLKSLKRSGAETTINMMGAMPAVAVRLERRKAEKRLKRPSQLYLSGYPHLRQQSASPSRVTSPSPSPLLSPPRIEDEQLHHQLPEVYVCGKVSALHLAVVSLLLGAVILIVGLVQLKPGADAPGHRYYLIAVGCILEVIGLIITAIRCVMLHMRIKRQRVSTNGNKKLEKNSKPKTSLTGNESVRVTNENNRNTQVEQIMTHSLTVDTKPANLKHLYNSSDVIYIDEGDSITGRRSKSPVESVSTIDVLMGNVKCEPVAHVSGCSDTMSSAGEMNDFLCPTDRTINM